MSYLISHYFFILPSEFTFLYNQLGPISASGAPQQKHLIKQIGQGLALIEFAPINVKSPANAFPMSCSNSPTREGGSGSGNGNGSRSGSGNGNVPKSERSGTVRSQSSVPLILLSGSQTALEDDIRALRSHVDKNEKSVLHPLLSPLSSTSSSETTPISSVVNSAKKQIYEKTVDGSSQSLPESVSELELKIYPTIPMQTQSLADFCTACFEKALTVYSVERLTSACSNGILTSSLIDISSLPSSSSSLHSSSLSPSIHTVNNSITTSHFDRGAMKNDDLISIPSGQKTNMNSCLSVKTSPVPRDYAHVKTGDSTQILEGKVGKGMDDNVSGHSFPHGPLFADFLRLYHSTLGVAAASPLFLTRSSGILHIPFLLPKHKSYSIRSRVIEKVLEAYPSLRKHYMESHCEPMFLGRIGTASKNVPSLATDKSAMSNVKGYGAAMDDSDSYLGRINDGGNKCVVQEGPTRIHWCETQSNSEAIEINSIIFGSSYSSPSSSTPFSSSLSPSALPKRSSSFTSKRTEQEDSTFAATVSSSLSQSGSQDNKDRAKANNNEKSRERSSSFTPPHVISSSSPFPPTFLPGVAVAAAAAAGGGAGGGDLRSLLDYDNTIASTLPLWLRRRAFSLEISVSTEGIFIFFFNLSPPVLNSVCDISASVAAAGVRAHNEEIRCQLVNLGILKERISSPMTVHTGNGRLLQDDVPISTFPTLSSLSPMKSGVSFSSSPFPHPGSSQVTVVATGGVGGIALSPRSAGNSSGIGK